MNKRRVFNLKPVTLLLAVLMVIAIVMMLLLKLDFNTIAAVTTLFALVVAISAMVAPNTPSDALPTPMTLKEYAAVRRSNIEQYEQEYVQLRVDEILYSKFEGIAALQRAATAPTQEPTQPYPSIEAVIAAHPKFVLLGNPGAGKSTLLQHIELKLLNKFEQESGLFPLWIDLGVEDNPENPHALIAAEWERLRLTDNVETRLGSGGLFLLLDGLNEMSGNRTDRSKKLRNFLVGYKGKCIVTCRESDYRDEMAFNQPQEIAEIRVPPLGSDQVKNFINTQVAKRQLSGEHAKSFLEKIYGSQGTIERKALAANPYALTMLLDLFTDPQYPFPQTREQHYDIYIEKAYKDNQKEKRGKTRIRTSFRRWKLALQQLAYAMMMEMKGTSVNSDWAARHIAPSRKWIYRRLGLAEFFEDELQSRLKHFATIEIKKLTYKKLVVRSDRF